MALLPDYWRRHVSLLRHCRQPQAQTLCFGTLKEAARTSAKSAFFPGAAGYPSRFQYQRGLACQDVRSHCPKQPDARRKTSSKCPPIGTVISASQQVMAVGSLTADSKGHFGGMPHAEDCWRSSQQQSRRTKHMRCVTN